MAESPPGIDTADLRSARREEKLQGLGRQIVSTLYMLVRNARLHSPDNAVFLKPVEQLREAINTVVATEQGLNLQAAETAVHLNGSPLRFDFAALQSVRHLTREFEQRDIGGFSTSRPVTSQEIRDFLYIFTSEFSGQSGERGAEGREMNSMRLARYSRVKELLEKIQEVDHDNPEIDRKKYLMTVYSRSVYYMRRYFAAIERGDFSVPFAKAGRLVQDLVDLCHDQRTHFLGVTTTRNDEEYLVFHSVNTALLSVVFGSELGLDRRQLHELGMAALFSQVGLVDVPDRVLLREGRLSEEERRQVDLFPLRTAKTILKSRGLDKSTMSRIVAAYESKVDFAIPRKTQAGEVELVMPKLGLGVYGKTVAICETYDALTSKRPFREAYGPEIALALMWGELKYRFDPVMLRIFMKVMAVQPIKILQPGKNTLRIG